jgi:hypothetical protein
METLYSVNQVKKEDGGRFVLSTGDPTGYSYHADFQNGWYVSLLLIPYSMALTRSGTKPC